MCAPTLDGARFPVDVYRAYRDGAAADIEFIIGIPGDELGVLRAFVGGQDSEKLIAAGAADMRGCMDASGAARAASPGDPGADSRLLEQWNALCACKTAARLAEGGGNVHLLCWNEQPLIENLGSGTVDAAAALLGNRDASQQYGNVMDADLSEVLQALLAKFIRGEALALYPNEIKGVDALEWAPFPMALVASEGRLRCDAVGDSLTEVKNLLKFMVK